MRLPVLREILPENFEISHLKGLFEQEGVGSTPFYLKLPFQNKDQAFIALEKIKQALQKTKIHPNFPYPLFIVTSLVDYFPPLQLAETEEKLDSYIPRKIETPKAPARGESFLGHIEFLREKIKEESFLETPLFSQEQRKEQEKLRDLTFETAFYEKVLEKWNI